MRASWATAARSSTACLPCSRADVFWALQPCFASLYVPLLYPQLSDCLLLTLELQFWSRVSSRKHMCPVRSPNDVFLVFLHIISRRSVSSLTHQGLFAQRKPLGHASSSWPQNLCACLPVARGRSHHQTMFSYCFFNIISRRSLSSGLFAFRNETKTELSVIRDPWSRGSRRSIVIFVAFGHEGSWHEWRYVVRMAGML